MASDPAARRYPIKVVVYRTGLTPHVIRVWERRYGAVSPSRTQTNRRLYSDADIERLVLLRDLTRMGHSISQIAPLPTDRLVPLAVGNKVVRSAPMPPNPTDLDDSRFAPYIASCLQAVERFDAAGLTTTLTRAAVVYSQPLLLESVIAPLMHHIGERWHAGLLRIAHEHLASQVVGHFLENLHGAYELAHAAPGLVVTTPAGQLHELGALMVASAARAEGWQVTYLGPNLPAEEIAASISPAIKAVALSLVYPLDDPYLPQELIKLRRGLAPHLAVLVGGRATDAYATTLETIGALRMQRLAELRAHLEALRNPPSGL